jgi:hypothetical protein
LPEAGGIIDDGGVEVGDGKRDVKAFHWGSRRVGGASAALFKALIKDYLSAEIAASCEVIPVSTIPARLMLLALLVLVLHRHRGLVSFFIDRGGLLALDFLLRSLPRV